MRIRELKYPIAVLSQSSFSGGNEAGTASPRGWNVGVIDDYIRGDNDDDIYFDSLGRQFTAESIEIRNIGTLQWLWHKMIFTPDISNLGHIDIVLRQVGSLSLEELRLYILNFISDNTSWLEKHPDDPEFRSNWDDIQEEFNRPKNFPDLINKLYFLSNPEFTISAIGASSKVIDLRKK